MTDEYPGDSSMPEDTMMDGREMIATGGPPRPTREEVLEGLRYLRERLLELALWHGTPTDKPGILDRAIAYLESSTRPAGCLNLLRSAEEAIEVLFQMRGDVGVPSWAAHVDLVVAYLETASPEALREKHAAQMEAVAEVWEATGNSSLCARANGLREAARMLREGR